MDDEKERNKIETENRENEKKRRYPPFFLIILLTTFGVLVALGLSFSAVNYMRTSDTINTIISSLNEDDSGKYIITYVENVRTDKDNDEQVVPENGIYLINQFPTSDETGKLFEGDNYVYNFSFLLGKKTKGAYYELTAVPSLENTLDSKYVKLYLEKDGHGVEFSYRTNGRVKTLNEYQKSEYEEADGLVIYKDYVTKEEAKSGKINFKMRIWISEDAVLDNSNSNKTFMLKINTYARSGK